MPVNHERVFDVLIIGAGPSGLACAIAAKTRGLSYLVIEQGGIADAIRRFPTEMRFYSTPEMLSIGGLPFVAESAHPTRSEVLRYYRAVCKMHDLNLLLHTKVTQAGRLEEQDDARFEVSASGGHVLRSKNLILATGYFDSAITLDVPGESLPHVSHYYTESFAYANCDVVIIGGGNSAVDAALELYRNDARVVLVHRGSELSEGIKYWTAPDIRNRIAEGSIQAHFSSVVHEIAEDHLVIENTRNKARTELPATAVFALTGYRASLDLLSQLGADCNFERGEPVHDGNFETSVPGLFCAGSANCGIHTSEIFIENGRTHAQQILPALRL